MPKNPIVRLATGRGAPWVLSAALALCLTVAMARTGYQLAIDSEPFFNNAEPRHVMTAVFWYDLWWIHPVSDPVGFTKAYYGRFPAIAPLHWPPLTHAICGAVFLVTGPSVFVARLMIASMMAIWLAATYRLVAPRLGTKRGLLTVGLLLTTTVIPTFAGVFMLLKLTDSG